MSDQLLSPEAPARRAARPGPVAPLPAAGALPGAAPERSPLFLEGWLAFNEAKWGVRSYCWRSGPGGPNAAQLQAVLYLDRRGRVVLPKLNPYLPVAFRPTPTRSPVRISRQWLEMSAPLVQEMCARRLGMTVMLPPEIQDMRPWSWAGLQVGVRYTFYNPLPAAANPVDPPARKRCEQARSAGYTCERTRHWAHALACVHETERHRGFSFGLTEPDLKQLSWLLGEESFRAYVCYDPHHRPVSARLILHCPGGRAIDWVCGTTVEHLHSGATQMLIEYVMDDLHAAGASGFDFSGANIRGVAAAKMDWGGQLFPYYTLQADYNLRTLAKWLQGWLRYYRTGRRSPAGASPRHPLPQAGRSPRGSKESGRD